jgi:NAD(P)-dependent dehydrogenase (short-subunit alcohol dehydrogenase family)
MPLNGRKNHLVPRIFITGSTDGLGRAAAGALMGEGHDIVLHARTRERAAALSDLAPDAAGVIIGDLSSAAETREVADQVNQIGRMDDAAATVSGGYWYHRQRQAPAPQARDPAFQDQLMDRLAALTGAALF